MTRQDSASENRPWLSHARGDEILSGETKEDALVICVPLMERVLERANLFAALKRVTQNKGGAGIDGMQLDELPSYLKLHWPRIRQSVMTDIASRGEPLSFLHA
jgi:hypothetical protein